MIQSHRSTRQIFVVVLVISLLVQCLTAFVAIMPQQAFASKAERKGHGDAQAGRAIFNGKGFCLNCHGRDGYIDQRPKLVPEIAEMIKNLNPKPTDFRSPNTLESKTEKALFHVIKEGHRDTAMFPKSHLTDKEILDLVAYLLAIKAEVSTRDVH